jgi:hypothetical protein
MPARENAVIKVFTFGLKVTVKGENRSETLRRFIIENKVTMVFDIRADTGNYYANWNCNGNHIAAMIKMNFKCYKCVYISKPELGISSQIRSKYKSDPTMCEFWYLNHIYQERLDNCFKFESDAERILLLCIENLKDPQTPYCHRIWLRNYLVKQELAELGEVVE